jgi:hypothetical protein
VWATVTSNSAPTAVSSHKPESGLIEFEPQRKPRGCSSAQSFEVWGLVVYVINRFSAIDVQMCVAHPAFSMCTEAYVVIAQ